MARKCAICGKESVMVQNLKKLRGKYNPTAKKRKYPNLQWVVIPKDAARPKNAVPLRGKRVLACTKCIKALKKTK
ncbi:MAG TPA: 50S ribosomal protein L28 [Candidatus Parcubacteria bacterium]|nr:50S ribosomal protein L28 [Candidatus Parcubacteria bacterium]